MVKKNKKDNRSTDEWIDDVVFLHGRPSKTYKPLRDENGLIDKNWNPSRATGADNNHLVYIDKVNDQIYTVIREDDEVYRSIYRSDGKPLYHSKNGEVSLNRRRRFIEGELGFMFVKGKGIIYDFEDD